MHIELRGIDAIRPYEHNPRRNDAAVDAVAKSLKTFGFRQPIVVDADGVIVVGHTRYKAARQLGLVQVPVHVAHDLTPEQARAYRIADNQTATLAEWDSALLPQELLHLQTMDFDLSLLGFDDAALTALLTPEPAEGLSDPEDIPEPPEDPITQPGDLWLLGEHRLLCGDSRDEAHVRAALDGRAVDLVLTDPPYGIDYEGNQSKRRARIANDTQEALQPLLSAALGLAKASCRPGAVWYVAAPAGPQFADFAAVLTDLGVWRQTLVWVKDAFVFGRSDYHYRHEAIFYGWVEGAAHQAPPDRTRTSVLEFARPKASPEHPTMKPVALWAELLGTSTAAGAVVYDPFGGSGTTVIAAEQLGRRASVIELEPGYCDVVVQRWENFTGQKAERREGGR